MFLEISMSHNYSNNVNLQKVEIKNLWQIKLVGPKSVVELTYALLYLRVFIMKNQQKTKVLITGV